MIFSCAMFWEKTRAQHDLLSPNYVTQSHVSIPFSKFSRWPRPRIQITLGCVDVILRNKSGYFWTEIWKKLVFFLLLHFYLIRTYFFILIDKICFLIVLYWHLSLIKKNQYFLKNDIFDWSKINKINILLKYSLKK